MTAWQWRVYICQAFLARHHPQVLRYLYHRASCSRATSNWCIIDVQHSLTLSLSFFSLVRPTRRKQSKTMQVGHNCWGTIITVCIVCIKQGCQVNRFVWKLKRRLFITSGCMSHHTPVMYLNMLEKLPYLGMPIAVSVLHLRGPIFQVTFVHHGMVCLPIVGNIFLREGGAVLKCGRDILGTPIRRGYDEILPERLKSRIWSIIY